MSTMDDAPSKDEDDQTLVPPVWRPTLEAMAAAIAAGDWQLLTAPSCVERVSEDDATMMREIVEDYGGVTLVPLPPETWETSVAMWEGDQWGVTVDLWSAEEGCTDLIMDVDVSEADDGYRFSLHLIYVP
jgi:hypothetical protein